MLMTGAEVEVGFNIDGLLSPADPSDPLQGVRHRAPVELEVGQRHPLTEGEQPGRPRTATSTSRRSRWPRHEVPSRSTPADQTGEAAADQTEAVAA